MFPIGQVVALLYFHEFIYFIEPVKFTLSVLCLTSLLISVESVVVSCFAFGNDHLSLHFLAFSVSLEVINFMLLCFIFPKTWFLGSVIVSASNLFFLLIVNLFCSSLSSL